MFSARDDRLWLLLVAVVTAALCLPFIRAVFSLGDEGVLLHGADRLLRGERLYADFFEFLPPGGFVLIAAWFKITGITFLSARLLIILTIVGIACFTYLACRLASGNRQLSALLTIGWVVMSQGFWTQVSHHWFTTLFSMAAAWAALASIEQPRRSLRWPLIAGLAAGMAGMITPTRGALATLAAMAAFLNFRQFSLAFLVYAIAVAAIPLGLMAYLAGQGSLEAAFDDVIRFTASRYASNQAVPFGSSSTLQNFLFPYLFQAIALMFLIICARDWRACVQDPLLRLCAAFGLAGFIGCFPRPDVAHIGFAAPLALPLLAWCTARLIQGWSPGKLKWLAVAAIGLCLLPVLVLGRVGFEALRGENTLTPRGVVTFVWQFGAAEMLRRIEATPKGDTYFFYPYMPLVPFLSAREHVAAPDIFTPGYTLPSQYHESCLSVMQRADWAVINWRFTYPERLKLVFPAMRDAEPPETVAFHQMLNNSFEFFALDGKFQTRRRRKGIGAEACAGSAE